MDPRKPGARFALRMAERTGSVATALAALAVVGVHAVVSQVAPDLDPFSWDSFAAALLVLAANLAVAGGLRIARRRWDAAWFLVHGGLLVAIAAGLGGSVFAVQARVILTEGRPSAALVGEGGDTLGYLPFGVFLRDFQIEEDAPRFTLVDGSATRIVFEKGDPLLAIEPGAKGVLRGIAFEVLQVLPHARMDGTLPVMATDSLAPPAALVRLRPEGGDTTEAWISCGGIGFPTLTAQAGSIRLAMGLPPARVFRSAVTILEPGTRPDTATIEVNRGFHRAGWTLQQLDYDKAAGRASRISVLHATHDPFAKGVHWGLLLALAGVAWSAVRFLRSEAS